MDAKRLETSAIASLSDLGVLLCFHGIGYILNTNIHRFKLFHASHFASELVSVCTLCVCVRTSDVLYLPVSSRLNIVGNLQSVFSLTRCVKLLYNTVNSDKISKGQYLVLKNGILHV